MASVAPAVLASTEVLPEGRGEAAASPIERQLRWVFALSNPLPTDLRDQTLWFYAPALQAPAQALESLNISMPFRQTTDVLGHSIVQLDFAHFPALAHRTVSVVANLRLQGVPRTERLDDPAAWLRAERNIEVDGPELRRVAAQLRRETPRDTARAIYDWVRGNLHYAGYVAEDQGAAEALATRRGDCTEYAYLAVALARANGIPARMLGGYDVDRNSVVRAQEYHNWAELHFDDRWNLVDAQKERWIVPSERYVVFRFYRDAVINPIGLAHRHVLRGQLKVGD